MENTSNGFSFEKVNEKDRGEDGHWVRYDGYSGRYSVCISTFRSGYRDIHVTTHRDTENALANLFAPNLVVVVGGITPVGVRIDMPAGTRSYHNTDEGKANWTAVEAEMQIAFTAAEEIQQRFIIPSKPVD